MICNNCKQKISTFEGHRVIIIAHSKEEYYHDKCEDVLPEGTKRFYLKERGNNETQTQ